MPRIVIVILIYHRHKQILIMVKTDNRKVGLPGIGSDPVIIYMRDQYIRTRTGLYCWIIYLHYLNVVLITGLVRIGVAVNVLPGTLVLNTKRECCHKRTHLNSLHCDSLNVLCEIKSPDYNHSLITHKNAKTVDIRLLGSKV
jgi:hypothetical protein